MIDNHVHIGQFREIYYEPLEIIQIIMESGIEGLAFSSTTTCKELVSYKEIEKEIDDLLGKMSYSIDIVQPYFWFIPAFIKQGITIEKAMSNLPYKGIKIHPFAHKWNFDNEMQIIALEEIFNYAQDNNMPILLHTGEDTIVETLKICNILKNYNSLIIILAHCNPLDIVIKQLEDNKNAYCDTAFVSIDNIKQIIRNGLKQRILLGSDFPITHWYSSNYPENSEDSKISLQEQYRKDFLKMKEIEKLINFEKGELKI